MDDDAILSWLGEQKAGLSGVSCRVLCQTLAEMEKELEKREALMKAGGEGVTDQWRVYNHIIDSIRLGEPLRLMVQASAGTGP